MTERPFVALLNAQIGNEFAAHNQYVACAAYYDGLTMPRMAAFFYAQALEERGHAMMMLQYLLDIGEQVRIPGVPAPNAAFDSVVAPVELALAQERTVTAQVNELLRTAREEGDYASEQFMQWFVKEQVEEVASMGALLAVVSRNTGTVENIEEYVARETVSEGGDAGTPPMAGG